MRRVLRSSDFSNIEGRVIAWLAGQRDKLDAFSAFDAGTGPDLYLVQAAAIYNVSIEAAYPYRSIGKVGELSLGFQGGPRAFAKMAKNYGMHIAEQYEGIWSNSAEEFKDAALAAWDDRGCKTGMSEKAWLASEVIKLAWRAKNHRIAAYWKEVEDAAIKAIRQDGEIIHAGKVRFRKVGSFLFCLLPSGRALTYPYPRLKEKETPWGEKRQQMVYKSVDQFTKKWGDKTAYGGLLVENCLGADTRVLTDRGLVHIVDIKLADKLWDGEMWVPHKGLIAKGKKATIALQGISITPDHKVLTKGGWLDASSCKKLSRFSFRVLDCDKLRRLEREKIPMASPLRLWNRENIRGCRTAQRQNQFLRVSQGGAIGSDTRNAWYERTSSICSMAFHARPLPSTVAQSLHEVWSKRHPCLSRMAEVVPEILGRYGCYLSARADVRSGEQYGWVLQSKLPMGEPYYSSAKYTLESRDRYTKRPDACLRSCRYIRHKYDDVIISFKRRLADIVTFCSTVDHKKHCVEPVYDILNAGPNHRFCVATPHGEHLIVANCTQASARDIMAEAMLRVDAAGYSLILTVHDELITEDDETFGSMDEFNALMTEVPSWAIGLPISVGGWEGQRYHK